MEKEDDNTASFCLSFSSYTGDGLAETAERVRLEFAGESNDDDGFEFVNLRSDSEAASFSGDCGLVFPIFQQNLVSKISDGDKDESSRAAVTTRLRDLLLRDREDPSPIDVHSSSSSSDEEEHELNRVSSEIYRPWTPEESPNGGWRKSKSTGSSSSSTSSRRWRIRDLLKRSYSEGKQSINFSRHREESSKKTMEKEKVSAHEKFYLNNKAMKEEEKRRSYLPYKQHLVGLFFNIHHLRYCK